MYQRSLHSLFVIGLVVLSASIASAGVYGGGSSEGKGSSSTRGKVTMGFDSSFLAYANGEFGGDTLMVGFGSSVNGIRIGYAPNRNWVVGARFNLAFVSALDADMSLTQIGFLPYFEYLMGRGKIRPFITGAVGFAATMMTDMDAVGHFTLGGGFGAHFFLTPGFSVDLSGRVDGYIGFDDQNYWQLAGIFGVSGWF